MGLTEGRKKEESRRNSFMRVCVITFLIAVYTGLGVFFHTILKKEMVYTHFAYLPIVIACMWWGRKGIVVALILGGLLFFFRTVFGEIGQLGTDTVRVLFMLVVSLLVGTLRSITEKREKLLREVQGRAQQYLDVANAIFVVIDENEKVLLINKRGCEILGYTEDEIVGKNWFDCFVPERVREKLRNSFRSLIGGEIGSLEEVRNPVLTKCGEERSIMWHNALLKDEEGKVRATLSSGIDITDKKQAEEKQKELQEIARKQQEELMHSTRLAELGEMAAAIAHELNQPLTGIANFARNASYMLEHSVGSIDEVKMNLRLISEQVDRAARIINRMRDLVRKTERRFVPVDINSVLRETIEFLMPQFRLSGVTVVFDEASSLPEVRGDKIQLEQVFLNILANARQAMERSEVRRLTIKTFLESGERKWVVVEVADTGEGFDSNVAQKLFKPFFSTREGGTGLGLSISLQILKEHKGSITATGEPGKGAKFTVKIPVDEKGEKKGGEEKRYE
ncbi:MAG: PAS domain S-box protein [Planctomycetota bacterium]|nr:PAS domain S-box protein [Planctomycetota bacterium]